MSLIINLIFTENIALTVYGNIKISREDCRE